MPTFETKSKSWLVAAAAVLAVAFLARPAFAYVGPGAGLSLLGALWGVLSAIVLAFAFVVAWPLRQWLRRRRAGHAAAHGAAKPAAERQGRDPARRHAATDPRSRPF